MGYTFTTRPNDKLIVRGPGVFNLCPYVANGAVGTGVFPGGHDAAIKFHFSRKTYNIMVEAFLNPIGSMVVEESFKITSTFTEMTLQKMQRFWNNMGNPLIAGLDSGVSGSLALGEDFTNTEWQLAIQAPAPPAYGVNVKRLFTFWRAVPDSQGEYDIQKAKPSTVSVSWTILTDPTALGAGYSAIGTIVDA